MFSPPPPMSVRWEEEYTVRIQLQERVNELQEVRVVPPRPLLPCGTAQPSPCPSHTLVHIDIMSVFPPGCRRPRRPMPAKRS